MDYSKKHEYSGTDEKSHKYVKGYIMMECTLGNKFGCSNSVHSSI